jgi:hypothetical protein
MKSMKVLGALAVLAMMGATNSQVSAASYHSGHNKEMNKPASMNKKRKDSLPDMIGGIQMITPAIGIPPHIYGQYHVKRGSHRKSNN